jgi:hypothetical protein
MAAPKKKKPKGGGKQRVVADLKQPSPDLLSKYAFISDFYAYPWKDIPLRIAYGVYALCLYGDYSDYVDVAVDAVTEGSNDRDIDFCYVDQELGSVFVGQSYLADEWGKKDASSNKAEDLLTGLSWLLKPEIDEIPKQIRSKAREVQDAIKSGSVTSLYLLYTHNFLQSESVQDSLRNVVQAAKILVENPAISVTAVELGLPKIQELYNSLSKLIVVDDEITFDAQSHYEEKAENWKSVSTTISGEQLHALWNKHGNELFSANVRGFLNMLRKKKSINRGILETIQQEPSRFWVFNNGITILTKKYDIVEGGIRTLGVSIINGAQTTGAIGHASSDAAKSVRVPCRFVECNDKDLIAKIIDKNNTQNEVKSFDLRSTDAIQKRLGEEFLKYGIKYLHRREGTSSLAAQTIQAEWLAPYLAAFHGHFQVSIRQRRSIFEDLKTYGDIFHRSVSAGHLYLVQTLSDAISARKIDLMQSIDSGAADSIDKEIHDLLQHSSSKCFVTSIIGHVAELILGRPIASRYSWVVAEQFIKPDRERMTDVWKLALGAILPFIAQFVGNGVSGYDTVRSQIRMLEVADRTRYAAKASMGSLKDQFDAIRNYTEIRSS